MSRYLFHSQFPGMDAIGNADAAIAVAGQSQPVMFFQSGIDPLKNLRMSEVVLRHSLLPQEDAIEERVRRNAQSEM